MNYTLEQLDLMEGHDFEEAVAELLRYNGWRDVTVTQGSGDYGIDILARRMNVKYAIQCKRYSKPVGNSAVQQAAAGVDYYHCDAAAVITNNTFTKQAETMAKAIGVRLWGRDFLVQLIHNYDSDYDGFYTKNQFTDPETGTAGASKICPACGREFFSSSIICPVCNYDLVRINSTEGKRAMAQKRNAMQTKNRLPAQVIPSEDTDIVKSSVQTSTGIKETQSVATSVTFRAYHNGPGTYAGHGSRPAYIMPCEIPVPETYYPPALPEYIQSGTSAESKGWTQRDEDMYNKIQTAFFLCLFFGFFGIHRFYLNKIGTGLLWLFTGGLFVIGWFIDLLNLVNSLSKISSARKHFQNQNNN